MKAKKNVLILTDDSAETMKMAKEIALALKGYEGLGRVSLFSASDFKGNDILPAEAFFLGCEKPKPDSFTYIADLFRHINLAGRPCGIFSPALNSDTSQKTVKYLASLIHDSEAVLNPEPLLSDSRAGVKHWSQKVISASF